ncbi:MAG: hypothetical protein ACKVS8_07410 [Phycisphaerales bacterium]
MNSALKDPLGRLVVLHDATWYGRILKGHPNLAPHRALVEQTVRTPAAVHPSVSDPDCRLYYGPAPIADRMMCVVANVREGFVMTAYFCKRLKPGASEWPPPNPSKE